jgi:hypothetical protein
MPPRRPRGIVAFTGVRDRALSPASCRWRTLLARSPISTGGPASPPPGPGRDRVLLPAGCACASYAGWAGAVGRSSLCVGLSARSLDGPWSPLPRFVLGVGVGGSRDALVHGLVRAGSCVTGERRPSDLTSAGSGSVAVPVSRARVRKDGGDPGRLPGATPRSLIGVRAAPGFSPGRGPRRAPRDRGVASGSSRRGARP